MLANSLHSLPKTKGAFVEPMDCLPVSKLPEGSQWLWEIKMDGYRAVAVKSAGTVTLYSRNRKVLNKRFPYIVEPLNGLPDGTVIDGEIVALDDDGRPVFNLLQNFTSEAGRIRYFVFDLLFFENRDRCMTDDSIPRFLGVRGTSRGFSPLDCEVVIFRRARLSP
jgi:ATP-dependent DNA ligase